MTNTVYPDQYNYTTTQPSNTRTVVNLHIQSMRMLPQPTHCQPLTWTTKNPSPELAHERNQIRPTATLHNYTYHRALEKPEVANLQIKVAVWLLFDNGQSRNKTMASHTQGQWFNSMSISPCILLYLLLQLPLTSFCIPKDLWSFLKNQPGLQRCCNVG